MPILLRLSRLRLQLGLGVVDHVHQRRQLVPVGHRDFFAAHRASSAVVTE